MKRKLIVLSLTALAATLSCQKEVTEQVESTSGSISTKIVNDTQDALGNILAVKLNEGCEADFKNIEGLVAYEKAFTIL